MYLPRKRNVEETWDGVLRVPFEHKDQAKGIGAVWDTTRRVWVVPPALRGRRSEFSAWDAGAAHASTTPPDLQTKRDNITRELVRAVCTPRA
jgi:hypothetical protein